VHADGYSADWNGSTVTLGWAKAHAARRFDNRISQRSGRFDVLWNGLRAAFTHQHADSADVAS